MKSQKCHAQHSNKHQQPHAMHCVKWWGYMWKSLSCVWLFMTPWIIVHEILQARILEWVAFPFSRESSQPRDWTQVSYIAGRFFTSWVTREAWGYMGDYIKSSFLIYSCPFNNIDLNNTDSLYVDFLFFQYIAWKFSLRFAKIWKTLVDKLNSAEMLKKYSKKYVIST